MYPGPDDRPVEEVRFRLEQYLGEVGRAYAAVTGHLKSVAPDEKVVPDPCQIVQRTTGNTRESADLAPCAKTAEPQISHGVGPQCP